MFTRVEAYDWCGFELDPRLTLISAAHLGRPPKAGFGRLKRERVNRRQYRTRAEARADIFDYIERFHNPMKKRELDGKNQGQSTRTQPSAISG